MRMEEFEQDALILKTKEIKKISVGPCWFCDWEPMEGKKGVARFEMHEGAIYVFCPKCGYEIPDAKYLLNNSIMGETVEE